MKLFAAVSTAFAISALFSPNDSVFAKSRWIWVAESQRSDNYIKDIKENGDLRTYERQVIPKEDAAERWIITMQANCASWSLRGKYTDGWGDWEEMLPGTIGDDELVTVCH